jgi:DNA-binding NarL/FixJ family response regulator
VTKEKPTDMPINILLLDDSKVARMQARRVIAEALPDAVVVDTDDQVRVFELAAATHFDLVLIDYNMPNENGLSLAERLKAAQPGLRMALLTANIQESIVQRAHSLGLEFMPKPLRPDTIRAAFG